MILIKCQRCEHKKNADSLAVLCLIIASQPAGMRTKIRYINMSKNKESHRVHFSGLKKRRE